jgi:DNA-binding transcriptional MerR regulator
MYTIGRLAHRARVNVDSIRFYERQGLVNPETKTDSGYRLYSDDAVRRIVFIKLAQRCGFSLADIGDLLQMHCANPAERRRSVSLLTEKQGEVRSKIASLETMLAALGSVLAYAAAEGEEHFQTMDSPLVTALEARLVAPGAPA